jgi:hypothetical protein
VHNVPALSIYASTFATALVSVALTALSGGFGDLMKFVIHLVVPAEAAGK